MTPADVSALVDLMVKHGCTRIVCGDVTIERPAPVPETPRANKESDFERFRRMSDDAQERFMHERFSGMPAQAAGMGRR